MKPVGGESAKHSDAQSLDGTSGRILLIGSDKFLSMGGPGCPSACLSDEPNVPPIMGSSMLQVGDTRLVHTSRTLGRRVDRVGQFCVSESFGKVDLKK
ncbi:hypothetical protein PIB30_064639 [Stylosanthes scabra]|uniref:Uncharacterized protein n=1 Tax=Stylosanthes scabra TaxID=79078 RepID=A0ABU6WK51_9FABA|nr:hypothetical protein [Stylosanthes scabra]